MLSGEDQMVASIFERLVQSNGPYVAPANSRLPFSIQDLPVTVQLEQPPVSSLFLSGSDQLKVAQRELNGKKRRQVLPGGFATDRVMYKDNKAVQNMEKQLETTDNFKGFIDDTTKVKPVKVALRNSQSSLGRKLRAGSSIR